MDRSWLLPLSHLESFGYNEIPAQRNEQTAIKKQTGVSVSLDRLAGFSGSDFCACAANAFCFMLQGSPVKLGVGGWVGMW